jgi:hypothetical protein
MMRPNEQLRNEALGKTPFQTRLHTKNVVPLPGIEPGLRAPQARVLSIKL